MKVQEIELKNKFILDGIKLDVNNEITIYCDTAQEDKILRIANIEGKIVIFKDCCLDVEIVNWEGNVKYKQKIRNVEDELEKYLEEDY